MLWMLSVILLIVWGWGYITQAAGETVHLLLVGAAAAALMAVLLGGRESVI